GLFLAVSSAPEISCNSFQACSAVRQGSRAKNAKSDVGVTHGARLPARFAMCATRHISWRSWSHQDQNVAAKAIRSKSRRRASGIETRGVSPQELNSSS